MSEAQQPSTVNLFSAANAMAAPLGSSLGEANNAPLAEDCCSCVSLLIYQPIDS
jgi:hypothetical protein